MAPTSAAWKGRRVGSFGRAAVLSFYPSKNLTVMGDGGAVLTDDEDLAVHVRRLRDHGRRSKDVHAEVGFNLRFNEIQAAIAWRPPPCRRPSGSWTRS